MVRWPKKTVSQEPASKTGPEKDTRSLTVVIGSLDVGGCETHLLTLLPLLKNKGFVIRVIVFKKGMLAPQLEAKGIPVIQACRWPLSPSKILRKIQLLFFIPFGIAKALWQSSTYIHFFLPSAYVLGYAGWMITRIFGKNARSKRIMSRRSLNYYQREYPLLGWMEKRFHKSLDGLLVNSQAIIPNLVNEGVLKEKVTLIYNGIHIQKFHQPDTREKKRQNLGISPETTVLIQVANFFPYKGHLEMVHALERLAQEKWDVLWLCVGRDTGYRSFIQKELGSKQLTHLVRFHEAFSEIPELLAASDIGVLSSHEEGFSNAILEMMAAALPVVATRVGGNEEAVIHGETGLLVPPHNSEKLFEALNYCLSHPQEIRSWGKKGYQRVSEHFSDEQCAENYSCFYNNLLKG